MRLVRAAAIAAALAVAPIAPAAAAPPQRVVVVTDGAGDDQWALAHLARAPQVELVGVLTTHAPALAYPGPKTAAQPVRAVLAAAGKAGVPVVPGLVEPFGGEQDIKPGAAVDFLLEASRGHGRERPLRVLVLGAATDVALALVVEPGAAERLELIATGFDAWPRGGDAGNVKADPLAWKLLLQSRVPLVVGDAAVAKRDLTLPRERARKLLDGRGALGAQLDRGLAAWLDQDPARRQADAAPMRDAAGVAWLLGHARAISQPRPQLAADLTLQHPGGGNRPVIRWLSDVDAAGYWGAFADAVGAE